MQIHDQMTWRYSYWYYKPLYTSGKPTIHELPTRFSKTAAADDKYRKTASRGQARHQIFFLNGANKDESVGGRGKHLTTVVKKKKNIIFNVFGEYVLIRIQYWIEFKRERAFLNRHAILPFLVWENSSTIGRPDNDGTAKSRLSPQTYVTYVCYSCWEENVSAKTSGGAREGENFSRGEWPNRPRAANFDVSTGVVRSPSPKAIFLPKHESGVHCTFWIRPPGVPVKIREK